MKLSSNKLVLIVGTLLILLFSFLLYREFTMVVHGGGKLVGTITFKKMKAKRKFARQVVWQEVEKETPIYVNDTIRTEELSGATIKLNNGTEIILNESSMIVVSAGEDGYNINFSQGSIHAKSAEGMDSNININAGGLKVALNKGDLNLNGGLNKVNLTMNKGEATIIGKDGKQKLKENQQVTAEKDDIRVYELNIRLLEPQQDTAFAASGGSFNTLFSWKNTGKISKTTLEISRTYSFRNKESWPIRRGTSKSVPLSNGIYYWRVQAVNPSTKKVESSKIRRFTIKSDSPMKLLSPEIGSTIRYRKKLPLVSFRWTGSDTASSYKITVSKNRNFSSPLLNRQVGSTGIGSDRLNEGTWYWRVEKVYPGNFQGKNLHRVNSSGIFTIVRSREVAPPIPIIPADKTKYTLQRIKKRGVSFSWKNSNEISSTMVTLSSNSSFTEDVKRFSTSTTYLNTKELKRGTYYWKVSGRLSDGTTTGSSPSRSFSVENITEITPLFPKEDHLFTLPNKENKMPVLFSWKKPEMKGTFTVTLSADEHFRAVYTTAKTGEASLQIPNIAMGSYYWKVTFTNSSGSISSKAREFSMRYPLYRPVITAPRGKTVDMLNKKLLKLAWLPQRGGTHYQVELFQKIPAGAKNIGVFETTAHTLEFKDLSKLDVGHFFITVRALVKKNGRVIRKGPETRADFTIILGKEKLDRPVINTPDTIFVE